jgi:phosphoglucosamine mutase
MGKLFGTDGIRGRANRYPMTPELALKVGQAVAKHFCVGINTASIVIGKDTRLSCDMIESALIAGICAAGGDVISGGVLPTPAIAYLTAHSDAAAGIVISASHNPYYDNGIKIFDQDGYKLSDDVENQLEDLINKGLAAADEPEPGCILPELEAGSKYVQFLTNLMPSGFNLSGMKIAIDCSNGATCQVAPELFSQLGAQLISLAVAPDGRNINDNCGSQHPENLIKAVLSEKADVGLAFDGDGDRLIAVDESGNVATGDQILAICANVMKKGGLLKNNTVVSTVMSNLGFRIALKKLGMDLVLADVGDRYVLAQMQQSGAVIGGEDSGHMIFLDHHTSGDGILTALKLIEAMQKEAKPLSELARIMEVFPQKLVNVEVKSKPEIETVPEIVAAIAAAEDELGQQGRVLVRYSGTQALCRVMVEAPTDAETTRHCSRIADIVKKSIG